MRRVLSLHLPRWSVDRVQRRRARAREHDGRGEQPVLLARTSAGRRLVAHPCRSAAAAGVSVGMSLSQARALLARAVHVEDHDPERDRAALGALGAWALRFSPLVALDPPDGLLLNVAGCERLHGGEPVLADALAASVAALGFEARVAVAGTVGCAWAAARFPRVGGGARACVPAGGERAFLAPLPVRALRLAPEALEALDELGIETVGHLAALAREELPARFGAELLLRLDQALGRALETLDPIAPREPPRVEREFQGPVRDVEAIALCVRELLRELTRELRRRERGALELSLELFPSDAAPVRETLALSRPSCDARHLETLLAPKLERAHLGFGIERVALSAAKLGRLRPRQHARWNDAAPIEDRGDFDRPLGELLDTLAGRLGAERTLLAEPVESHLPERAFHTRHVRSDGAPRGPAGFVRADRPAVLFAPPEPSDVRESESGAPAQLRWRGESERVVRCFGPERIAEPWWQARAPYPRDYFRIRTERGRWLWIYREAGSARWFVHGEWV